MPRAPAPSATHWAGTPDDVEIAFYEALQRGGIERLMPCWSDEDEVVCIHPGGSRQLGLVAIREAFEAMFAQGVVRARPVQVHRRQDLASAVHSVSEPVEILLPDGVHHVVIFATNVYQKTLAGWRLVAHHASHGAAPSEGKLPPVLSGPRPVLH